MRHRLEPSEVDALLREAITTNESQVVPGEHIPEEKLWQYSSGELSSEEQKVVDRHLRTCSVCARELQWADLSVEAIEGLGSHSRSSPSKESGRYFGHSKRSRSTSTIVRSGFRYGLPLAAALLLLILLLHGPSGPKISISVDARVDPNRGIGSPRVVCRLKLDPEEDLSFYACAVFRSKGRTKVELLYPVSENARTEDPRYADWPNNPIQGALGPVVIPPERQAGFQFETESSSFHLYWIACEPDEAPGKEEWQSAVHLLQKEFGEMTFGPELSRDVKQLLEQSFDLVNHVLITAKNTGA